MRGLIKLGGTLLDDTATRSRLASEIAALAKSHEVTVVHGGGKQMTRYLTERGIESKFLDGLRVTTPEVIDALLKVFAGSVNHELVASLTGAGARPVGLTGLDAGLAVAEPLDSRLGAVGRIVSADASVLVHLVSGGLLPVVACVAGGRNGEIFNVNADQMAVACASAFSADVLVFLTDVAGVRGAGGEILRSLTASECEQLIAAGVATGGMQAKLNAATDALRRGISQVIIAPGADANAARLAFGGQDIGTRIHS